MMYQVWERNGLVKGFFRGPQQNGSEPAPEGLSPENAYEWIKGEDGKWKHDPEAAKAKRKELDDANKEGDQ